MRVLEEWAWWLLEEWVVSSDRRLTKKWVELLEKE
jgi:hypothetical protein